MAETLRRLAQAVVAYQDDATMVLLEWRGNRAAVPSSEVLA